MEKLRFVVIASLLLILILRIIQNGGLYKEKHEILPSHPLFPVTSLGERIALNSENILPQPQSSLLMGMVLGVKTTMPKEFKTTLERTGTIHIVVVSGQNLTLLAGFIMALAKYLGRKKTLVLTLSVLSLYSVLTGFEVPVIRAALMFLFVSIAQFFNRESEAPWILVITALLMLVFNPNWLLSISFQLSFLATIGVVVVAPLLIRRLKFLPNLFKEDFAVSLAAFLMTLPVIASNFHQISLIGVLVNVLVLWTVPFIMVTGAAGLIVYLLIQPLGLLISLIPGVLLTYFVYIVSFFNKEWVSIYVPNLGWITWLGYYFILAGIFLWLKKPRILEDKIDVV